MSGWIVTIVLGLIAGIIGKILMPGKDPGGLFITILLGIGGAALGRFLGPKLGIVGAEAAGKTFDLMSIGLSVVGVIILLVIYRLIFGKKKK